MAFKDLREFIAKLEEEGELTRIKQEVDWDLEVGAILRRSCEIQGTAAFFERIKGYPQGYRIMGDTVSSRQRLALAFGLPKDTSFPSLMDFWDKGVDSPIKPRLVSTGPCKENILKGEDVNLYKFPVPMSHDGDGGRYMGTWHSLITKDLNSEWVNWGMYRMMVHNRNHLGGLLSPFQHIGGIFGKYEELNKPMEFAVAIGTEPVCGIVSASTVPHGVDEVDMAGALRSEPVDLVKCETVDLMVPATAEIVLEGHVLPGVRVDEGPFGEYTGYMGGDRAPRAVYKVSCITHRNDPILTSTCTGIPWDVTSTVTTFGVATSVRRALKREGIPIRGVNVPAEGSALICIVSTKTPYPGIAHTIASIIWGDHRGHTSTKVIVVNDDIDPYNMAEVIHAFATKHHPIRGTHVAALTQGNPLIPYQPVEDRVWEKSCNILYDCTWPVDWPESVVPRRCAFNNIYPEHIQKKVIANWKDYGFKE